MVAENFASRPTHRRQRPLGTIDENNEQQRRQEKTQTEGGSWNTHDTVRSRHYSTQNLHATRNFDAPLLNTLSSTSFGH